MIRQAVLSDIEKAERVIVDAVSNNAVLPPDFNKLGENVIKTIEAGRCFVAEHDGMIIGSAAYDISSPFYSSHRAMSDMWLNVLPEFRGGTAGGRLLVMLRQESQRLGLPYFLGASGKAPEAIKLYESKFDETCRVFRGK